jgi:hypothetical protein
MTTGNPIWAISIAAAKAGNATVRNPGSTWIAESKCQPGRKIKKCSRPCAAPVTGPAVAERRDDDGRREQPGNSLKGPFHAMSPFGAGAGQVRTHRLPVLKRGFCVSIVSGRDSGSVAVVAGCIYCLGRWLGRRSSSSTCSANALSPFTSPLLEMRSQAIIVMAWPHGDWLDQQLNGSGPVGLPLG